MLRELESEMKRLERKLRSQGYSLKKINGQIYLYTWTYRNKKQEWKYIGNINKIDISQFEEERTKELLSQYMQLQNKKKLIEEKIKEILA